MTQQTLLIAPSKPARKVAPRDVVKAIVRPIDSAVCSLLRVTSDSMPGLSRLHDRILLRHRMTRALGYRPNYDRPLTYNEKLGWRILNDRNPLLALTTDKVAVRDYVASKVGDDILVPIIGVYRSAAEIPWADLPEQFVLKASHGCNMNIIVRDKSAEDPERIRQIADGWLRQNFYEQSREWGYRDIQPRLLVEELLTEEDGGLPFDFKFMVFGGKVAVIRVHVDRFGDHRVNFYGPDLQTLPVRQEYPTDPGYRPPAAVAGMVDIAERIGAAFDYARVDLYLVRGRVRFGEITHYDGNAAQPYRPQEFDRQLGDLWQLPAVR